MSFILIPPVSVADLAAADVQGVSGNASRLIVGDIAEQRP
jgi:hypothetical protein